MGRVSSKDLTYLIQLPESREEDLGSIRHWPDLKVAFDAGDIWVKGFTKEQLESVDVKSIPYLKRWRQEGSQLFPANSGLPERLAPTLMWSPIERGLVVKLPSLNHNYFGNEAPIRMRLVPSEKAYESTGLILPLEQLAAYLDTAPEVRLQDLYWTVLDEQDALVVGTPALPLPGLSLWVRGNLLFPAGYDLEFPVLASVFEEKLDASGQSYHVWIEAETYFTVSKNSLEALTRSSLRKTVQALQA